MTNLKLPNGMKIGFFDSGIGGLIILNSVADALPQYDYVYYGDTKNLPYGDKNEKQIYKLTKVGIEYLFSKNCLLVIVACNTASAETLRRLQDTFLVDNYPERKILGVIVPTVEDLVNLKSRQALLLATKRTIDSNKYSKELIKYENKNSTVLLIKEAVPDLVPMIEKNKISEAIVLAKKVINRICEQVGEIDTIILGCTHYSLLKDGLRDSYQSKLNILSQDEIIPRKVTEYLDNHPEISKQLSARHTKEIHLTETREEYGSIVRPR